MCQIDKTSLDSDPLLPTRKCFNRKLFRNVALGLKVLHQLMLPEVVGERKQIAICYTLSLYELTTSDYIEPHLSYY